MYRPEKEHWLRRDIHQSGTNLDIDEVKMLNILKYKYGLKHVHSEEEFYNLFKISRRDFLNKIEKIDDPQKVDELIFETIYDSQTSLGRKGILTLRKSISEIKKKI